MVLLKYWYLAEAELPSSMEASGLSPHKQKPATGYHIALVILPPIKQISSKLL